MRIYGNFALRLLLAAVFAASAAAQAEDFRVQAQLRYDQFQPDEGDDVDAFAFEGTYYFSPVPTDGVPVGEAAHIARSSYASVLGTKVDLGDGDVDAIAANVGYHVPNTIFFGRVGVVHAELSDALGGGDDTSWNGTFGIVPIPRLFLGTDFTEDGYDPNITVHYAGKLANDHWYGATVSASDPDEGDSEVGLDFNYYFDGFKLGGGFNTGGDRWTARAEFGLPHGFALQGQVFTQDGGDGFGLQLTWRDL